MKALTVDVLVACGANRIGAAKYIDALNELLPYYKVTSLLRLAHFIGQVLQESDRMKTAREYASGAAYEGREDLGNIHPGDGVLFAGRGLIQTTGRSNYEAFAEKFGIDCVNQPELLEEPRWAVASALYYWHTRKLNSYADKNLTWEISCIVNLGSVPPINSKRRPNHAKEREQYVLKSKKALAVLFE